MDGCDADLLEKIRATAGLVSVVFDPTARALVLTVRGEEGVMGCSADNSSPILQGSHRALRKAMDLKPGYYRLVRFERLTRTSTAHHQFLLSQLSSRGRAHKSKAEVRENVSDAIRPA